MESLDRIPLVDQCPDQQQQLHLMAPYASFSSSIEDIIGVPLGAIVSLFSKRRAQPNGHRTDESVSNSTTCWIVNKFRQPPLVIVLALCLVARAVYYAIAVIDAPNLKIRWLLSTLMLTCALLSFRVLGAIQRAASADEQFGYSPLERLALLHTAAQIDGQPRRRALSVENALIASALLLFCVYILNFATFVQLFVHLPLPSESVVLSGNLFIGLRFASSPPRPHNGSTADEFALGIGDAMTTTITALVVAGLCGLAGVVHQCLVQCIHTSIATFVEELHAQIVSRQISKNDSLEALVCRADNLLRFVFFARTKLLKSLIYPALLTSFAANLSLVAFFWQLQAVGLSGKIEKANRRVNNVLMCLLFVACLALARTLLKAMAVKCKIETIERMLALEGNLSTDAKSAADEAQRLAEALVRRLDECNRQRIGAHQIQLIFMSQFLLTFIAIRLLLERADILLIAAGCVSAIVLVSSVLVNITTVWRSLRIPKPKLL